MRELYDLLKVSIDPVFFLIIIALIGFLVSLKQGKEKYGKYVLLIVGSVLYVTSIFPTSNLMYYLLERDYLYASNSIEDNLDIVIVLGGGALDNEYLGESKPSSTTSSRLLYAVQMFRKTGAEYIVCSGRGTTILSEAEVMASGAERLGVPRVRIKIDPFSNNTWEHAENINEMFPDKQIRVGLVTSAYHMKRSVREFEKYFHDLIPLPADYLYVSSQLSVISFIPRSGNFNRFANAMHEMIGVVWYRLKSL